MVRLPLSCALAPGDPKPAAIRKTVTRQAHLMPVFRRRLSRLQSMATFPVYCVWRAGKYPDRPGSTPQLSYPDFFQVSITTGLCCHDDPKVWIVGPRPTTTKAG